MSKELDLLRLRQKLVGNELADHNSGRETLLTITDAERFQHAVMFSDNYLFWGKPLKLAIRDGYQVTVRGIFECTEQKAAIDTASDLKDMLSRETRLPKLRVLDAFAGTGQNSWAFAQEGFEVLAFENQPVSCACFVNNLDISGLSASIEVVYDDVVTFLKSKQAKEAGLSAIYLDPPWNGKYKYDLDKPFYFSYTEPPMDQLVIDSLDIVPIVILKAPQNIHLDSIKSFAQSLGLGAKIVFQDMHQSQPGLNQATIYFTKGVISGIIEERKMLFP